MPSHNKKIHKILADLKLLDKNSISVDDSELFAIVVFKVIYDAPEGALLVVENSSVADAISEDIKLFLDLSGDKREFLEFPEYRSGKGVFQPDNDSDRNLVLARLLEKKAPSIVLTTVSAFSSPVSDPETFQKSSIEIKVGDSGKEPEDYAEMLVAMDYDNEFQVSLPGEFARRGGILDVFSPVYNEAHRIEFFGDEVESIRTFDPQTQKSTKEVSSVSIVPRSGKESETGSLMDYCEGFKVVIVDKEKIESHLKTYFDEEECETYEENLERVKNLSEISIRPSDSEIKAKALAPLYRTSFPEISSTITMMHKQFVIAQLEKWTETGCSVFVFCGSKGNLDRLKELISDSKKIKPSKLSMFEEGLSKGVFLTESRTVLLSQNEIFGRDSTVRKVKSARQQALEAFLEAEPELSPGDYAVHAGHGICRYDGIELQDNNGVSQEVMVLEFAEERKLYVPLESSHLVSRYIGGRKGVPKLSRLGGVTWKNARAKAEESATDLAADLLRLQAVRKHSKGHLYAPDNDWQIMFEESFSYEETEDQLKAIEAVKKDMESPQPMDRLICGDVGFGKTEVALRAAFKAVMDERQVAVIVPTTVLAQQHFRTFTHRMADYPVDIRLLCRFVTKKEQNKTLEDMALGACDIVIGTHRLLQKDIQFERLGLIIIDEEQRFGVEDKEQLKRMRATVDILTMTATPIPRTLYFSLAGLRDFSTIMTPPVERKPVKTIIAEENDDIIRQAILREIERGGQVYFLHNRVQTIEKMAHHIQKLVPEAKVIFGHGQMKDSELESVMRKLLEKKCDVLVSTTIIESGLDNPDANTMIIDRADRFGLAELYQLRGRVGRYHHQAYCYLLLPKQGLLMDTARQRLAAIRRYTHLGAGFKLALRDLEIRGAGNLLGKEQSGHIAAVGFDMYCKLLKQSVNKLEKKPENNEINIHMNIDFMPMGMSKGDSGNSACLSPDYVTSEVVRLETYKRAARIKSLDRFESFKEEILDRFGSFPKEVANYFKVLEIRVLSLKKGIHSVAVRDKNLFLEDEDGYIKRNGRVPVLKSPESLDQIIRIIKGI